MKRSYDDLTDSDDVEAVPPAKRVKVVEKWACRVCTFLNEPLHLACGMCNTPKQAEPKESSQGDLMRGALQEDQEELVRKMLHEEHNKAHVCDMKAFAKRVNWGDERRPWNTPGSLVSSTGQKEYRKIQVMISFGWLCFDGRGHMTILDWYDRNLGHPLTEYHVQRVKEICDKYCKVARRNQPIGSIGNCDDNAENSFLFDPERNPPVDPDGVLARMLAEFGQIPVMESDPNGPKIGFYSTGGGDLAGLHVTAGIDPTKCPQRHFDTLRARHGNTNWMRAPRRVYVLPMNVKKPIAVNPAPLPCNEALFEFLMQEGAARAATVIANSTEHITNLAQACKIRGIGKKSGQIIKKFFERQ